MPEYVIEREVPGAGQLTESQIRDVSLKSIDILKDLWSQGFSGSTATSPTRGSIVYTSRLMRKRYASMRGARVSPLTASRLSGGW